MDLSDQSLQPMIDENTGNVIIFNGSIYNYKDLKGSFHSNKLNFYYYSLLRIDSNSCDCNPAEEEKSSQ